MKNKILVWSIVLIVSLFSYLHLNTINISAKGHTEAILLSCMDYRLTSKTLEFMSSIGMEENYDHVILAGASLGAVTDKFPSWNQTFIEHLEIAIQLHNIRKVILLDHRDCGAYKVIFDEDFSIDAEKETQIHSKQLFALRSLIEENYKQLEVEMYLMGLDGTVEEIK